MKAQEKKVKPWEEEGVSFRSYWFNHSFARPGEAVLAAVSDCGAAESRIAAFDEDPAEAHARQDVEEWLALAIAVGLLTAIGKARLIPILDLIVKNNGYREAAITQLSVGCHLKWGSAERKYDRGGKITARCILPNKYRGVNDVRRAKCL